ncbi:Isoquinoline 1-oxidoreductase subunit [Pseudorhodoplanes sp.]|uniref:Isoquinoline 1-oxidoreductase subunit n=1 Tax=Pseudorhodoplanes sp. TaxID=1934341 RepID=UPI003D0D063F
MRLALVAAVSSGAIAAIAIVVGVQQTLGQPRAPLERQTLQPASAFNRISDTERRSVALFEEAGKVLTHPRCVNCHPRGDRPFQTDLMRPHQPLVVRGADGHGVPTLQCATCHHNANFDPARVPGDPHWHLAPREMAWEGMTVGQICAQLKDPARNGKRDLQAILKHVREDSLVGWGWNPGADRTPAPGTQAQFADLIEAWIDTGAHCPAS